MRQEQDLLDDLLMSEKQLCSTYSTAVTEAVTRNVRNGFQTNLSTTFTTQDDVFKAMTNKGWYQPETAQPNKVSQAKTKYSQKPSGLI